MAQRYNQKTYCANAGHHALGIMQVGPLEFCGAAACSGATLSWVRILTALWLWEWSLFLLSVNYLL